MLAFVAALTAAHPASTLAHHVSADPQVSARVAERLSSQSWIVIVDWSINCGGAADPSHGGDLYLVDVDTGEEIYMGGTFSPSGSDRQPVSRGPLHRRVRPRLKASCFDNGPGLHGSGTKEVLGNVVTVPRLGDEDGDGQVDPSPGGGDLIRARSGDDCLIGSAGDDRLYGQGDWDRLTGGTGSDLLVGGSGRNSYSAGAGDDRILAVNGKSDLVSCGPGRDLARVDRVDAVRGCETVTRAAPS